ncbi:MAG: hypothetical protein SGI83_15530 [Bacteroidota bacterium]|nr:hypothetical protein [Bacteroidota bacterium]
MVTTVPSFKVFFAMVFNIFSSKEKIVFDKSIVKMMNLLANRDA